MSDFIFVVGDIVLLIAAIGAAVFAVSYAGFFNWRKTAPGRALMYFVWSLIAVFVNNVFARTFGTDYAFREWVRLVVYVAVAFTIWRLVWVLWRNWRADLPPLDIQQKTRKEKNR